MDEDDFAEALQSAAGVGRSTEFGESQTAPPTAVSRLRRQLAIFFEDLPGDLTISEVREGLDRSRP